MKGKEWKNRCKRGDESPTSIRSAQADSRKEVRAGKRREEKGIKKQEGHNGVFSVEGLTVRESVLSRAQSNWAPLAKSTLC